MKEIPILFSGPMVNAILEGRKTMTRRIVNDYVLQDYCKPDGSQERMHHGRHILDWPLSALPYLHPEIGWAYNEQTHADDYREMPLKARWQPGDILWVREGFLVTDFGSKVYYKAGPDILTVRSANERWKPSIHMPKSACRIYLQVEDVRVERLQDISEEDAKAEGVAPKRFESEIFQPYDGFANYFIQGYDDSLVLRTAKDSFESLWHVINGTESWEENPWVWVVKFKVLSTTGRPEILAKEAATSWAR